MPPKCKHSSKAIPSSQSTADDDAVSLQMKHVQRADQLFDEELVPLDNMEPNQPRHSSHAGRGDATQDKPVNPMAPGYAEDEQESQILLWAVESIPPFAEQSPKVWPSFKHSQPSQPFSFKLPSQASTGGTQSTRSYNSHLSSGNPSIFSCLTRFFCDDWDGSQLALPKWLLQLWMLAMAKDHTLDVPQHNSCVHTHSSLSFSGTPVQGQHPVHDNGSPSPPPQPPGLH
ncbi:hypothetical protein EDD17DRAFT_1759781 [Pisolithus thermaeus]|nr:hypothetical protein EV401DRAFT_2077015 [Pisolithus croceorrhizus]KAI6161116.1 hypothetical protein EDD17DRAFT_1759781 [Pisolithus thermaeus]